jgi:hypothetical protein
VKTHAFIFLDDFIRHFPRPVKKEDIAGIEHTDRVQAKLLTVSDKVPLARICADDLVKDPMVPWFVACH